MHENRRYHNCAAGLGLDDNSAVSGGVLLGDARETGWIVKLTDADYDIQARALGCEDAILRGFTEVESAGDGFAPDGRVIIRVEAHRVDRYWGKQNSAAFAQNFKYDQAQPWLKQQANLNGTWTPYHGNQDREWQVFEKVKALCGEDVAIMSTSFGLFQVLGENFKECGCATPLEFFGDHCESEARQLERAVALMKSKGMLNALRNKDFVTLSDKWNGKARRAIYVPALQKAYAKYMLK